MKKYNVVFCGTPDFSVPSLEILHQHPLINLCAVVTMPDRPAGRGKNLTPPPVATFATENKIKLFQVENLNQDDKLLTFLEKSQPDFMVVLAFAQFLSKKVLNIPTMGCFNIHTSLLPKYRGAAPIQYALLNGDQATGVSIQKMVSKMDAGDIAYSSEVQISSEETGGQLYTRLKFLAATALNDFIHSLANKSIAYTPQNEKNVSFAPSLKKEDGLLSFSEKTFFELKNQVRGLHPWPGTYCFLNGKRLKVFEIEPSPEKLNPGEVSTQHGCLVVGLKDCSIRLSTVQLEGKKRCSDFELLNGIKNGDDKIFLSSQGEKK